MISDFFIDRPIFATVIALVIVLAGAASIPLLPVAQFPTIIPPAVQVTASYTGANAGVIEKTVTNPIEEQVNGVEGMIYMSSTSSNDGTMSTTVTFDIGYDLDIAAVDTQNRVEIAQSQLPGEVIQEGIITTKQSPDTILYVSLVSPNRKFDTLFLSNYADIHITNVLQRIPGVGNVTILGERKYALRIWLKPDKLASLGLTTTDVAAAVSAQNLQVPAGMIGQPPVPPGQQFQYSINTLGRLSDVSQFEDIILRTKADGSIVRIKNVARVELGAENYETNSKVNGMPAVTIAIYQFPNANAIDIARQAKKELGRLAERFPEGLEYRIIYDVTRFVKASIKEVLWTLFEAMILVFLVVYFFLRDWRTTLIPAITIPVSLIGTFALLNALGLSTNTLTLFGLVLAVGLVVDDAIIVVENVSRHLQEENVLPREAAKRAMKDVTEPVIATTLVLMAVFIPVAFTPGVTGQLYKQFALTVACSVGISGINALTLSPALCAVFLRSGNAKQRVQLSRSAQMFERIRQAYEQGVGLLIRFRLVVLMIFVALLVLTYHLFQVVPTGFVPKEDQGYFVVIVQLPEGASLQRTTRAANEIEKILLSTSGVSSTLSISGLDLIGGGNASNSAALFPILTPWSQRTSPELQINAIMSTVKDRFASVEQAIVIAVNPPPIPGLGSTGGFQFELQDVQGGSLNELARQAQEIIRKGNARPELTGLFTTYRINTPQLFIDLDRTKTMTQDIQISDVFDTLQAYLGGLYVNDFNKFGRVYRVYLQAEPRARTTIPDISRLYVNNGSNDAVPLSTLLRVNQVTGPEAITHYNTYRSIAINGEAAAGYSSGEAIAAMEQVAKESLPPNMSYAWTSTAYQQIQAGHVAPFIFALSLVLVFLLLAAQYESWMTPFIIMLAVPLAMLGALGAQSLSGLENDVYCQIGLLMLIGLASKNAILIVEFAKRRCKAGLSIEKAAMEAARIRLRPILMTAFAFILGVFPMVIATGAGAASRHSLGTAVFGGMIVATLLSLLLVPVLFVLIERLRQRTRRT